MPLFATFDRRNYRTRDETDRLCVTNSHARAKTHRRIASRLWRGWRTVSALVLVRQQRPIPALQQLDPLCFRQHH